MRKSQFRKRNSAEESKDEVGGHWITYRRISQIVILILFSILFLSSKYPLQGQATVDQFFKVDPLIFLLVSLAARGWLWNLAWSVLLLALAVLLGRFFCGWVCPLGTSIDVTRRSLKRKEPVKNPSRKWMWLKYATLVFLATSALLSLGLFWFFDPISIMLRSMTLFLYPLFASAISYFLETISLITALEDPALDLLDWLKQSILPVYEQHLLKSLLVASIFLSIILIERYRSRFWCRYLCPLGALLGLVSKKSILQRKVSPACTDCGICQRTCRMAAIADDPVKTSSSECIFCMDCSVVCPERAITYSFVLRGEREKSLDLSRRRIIASGLYGLVGVGLFGISAVDRAKASTAIRPPGAVPENEYLDRCVRCYACIRACSTSGRCLQPSLTETGIEGLLTPAAVMRLGYCEYNCNLCGTVCPTGAIHEISEEDKKKRKMGLAEFDRGRCIPWVSGENCIVCEEHCPVPEKAIKFESREVWVPGSGTKLVKIPFLVKDRCIGCGICETKCPVRGKAAIIVTREGEERWIE